MTTLVREADRIQEALHTLPFREWSHPDGSPWAEFHRSDGSYIVRFPGLADFRISLDGQQVVCGAAVGVSEETVLHLYENQVYPLALSRIGKLVLHASAVEVEGQAIAFIGESRRGKSTLAASFATKGFRFLADDGVVLESGDSGYVAMPGHPSIRLWQDSHDAVFLDRCDDDVASGRVAKALFVESVEAHYCGRAKPLRRVYILGQRDSTRPEISAVSRRDAFMEAARNSFLLETSAAEAIAGHFDQLTRFVSRLAFFRLDYPRRFDALPDVRAAILDHCDA